MTAQNSYFKPKLGYPADPSKAQFMLEPAKVQAAQQAAASPAPAPQQAQGSSMGSGAYSPSLGAPSSPAPAAASPAAPAQEFGKPIERGEEKPESDRPHTPPLREIGKPPPAGGGGASGKMMYRPQVSQSRISTLRAMLNLPRLK